MDLDQAPLPPEHDKHDEQDAAVTELTLAQLASVSGGTAVVTFT